jgi:hypothetical protein
VRIWRCVVAVVVLTAFAGCRDDGKESFAKKAGKKVGETVIDFGSGVGSGVDTKLTIPVELSEAMTAKGLSKTVAKTLVDIDPDSKGFAVYLVSKERCSGSLLAKSVDSQGREIGRSMVDVAFEPDDAKYVTFTFPKEMDSALVAKYVIDVKKQTGPSAAPHTASPSPEIPKSPNP